MPVARLQILNICLLPGLSPRWYVRRLKSNRVVFLIFRITLKFKRSELFFSAIDSASGVLQMIKTKAII